MWTRVGIGLGIVFLMCVKPMLVGSLIAIAVSVVVGAALALLTMGSRRSQPVTA
jgi:hypothetical protein